MISGDNAKASAATPGTVGGYTVIAHKANGAWSVTFRGQEMPDRAFGERYGLPTDWYNAE